MPTKQLRKTSKASQKNQTRSSKKVQSTPQSISKNLISQTIEQIRSIKITTHKADIEHFQPTAEPTNNRCNNGHPNWHRRLLERLSGQIQICTSSGEHQSPTLRHRHCSSQQLDQRHSHHTPRHTPDALHKAQPELNIRLPIMKP